MPDDHSEVVPLLPIPNRTVKRFSADDSADSRVKVGHRQALIAKARSIRIGLFLFLNLISHLDQQWDMLWLGKQRRHRQDLSDRDSQSAHGTQRRQAHFS